MIIIIESIQRTVPKNNIGDRIINHDHVTKLQSFKIIKASVNKEIMMGTKFFISITTIIIIIIILPFF